MSPPLLSSAPAPGVPHPDQTTLSDLEKLRKLKESIKLGQHPFFVASPHIYALESLRVGGDLGSRNAPNRDSHQDHPQPVDIENSIQSSRNRSSVTTDLRPMPQSHRRDASASSLTTTHGTTQAQEHLQRGPSGTQASSGATTPPVTQPSSVLSGNTESRAAPHVRSQPSSSTAYGGSLPHPAASRPNGSVSGGAAVGSRTSFRSNSPPRPVGHSSSDAQRQARYPPDSPGPSGARPRSPLQDSSAIKPPLDGDGSHLNLQPLKSEDPAVMNRKSSEVSLNVRAASSKDSPSSSQYNKEFSPHESDRRVSDHRGPENWDRGRRMPESPGRLQDPIRSTRASSLDRGPRPRSNTLDYTRPPPPDHRPFDYRYPDRDRRPESMRPYDDRRSFDRPIDRRTSPPLDRHYPLEHRSGPPDHRPPPLVHDHRTTSSDQRGMLPPPPPPPPPTTDRDRRGDYRRPEDSLVDYRAEPRRPDHATQSPRDAEHRFPRDPLLPRELPREAERVDSTPKAIPREPARDTSHGPSIDAHSSPSCLVPIDSGSTDNRHGFRYPPQNLPTQVRTEGRDATISRLPTAARPDLDRDRDRPVYEEAHRTPPIATTPDDKRTYNTMELDKRHAPPVTLGERNPSAPTVRDSYRELNSSADDRGRPASRQWREPPSPLPPHNSQREPLPLTHPPEVENRFIPAAEAQAWRESERYQPQPPPWEATSKDRIPPPLEVHDSASRGWDDDRKLPAVPRSATWNGGPPLPRPMTTRPPESFHHSPVIRSPAPRPLPTTPSSPLTQPTAPPAATAPPPNRAYERARYPEPPPAFIPRDRIRPRSPSPPRRSTFAREPDDLHRPVKRARDDLLYSYPQDYDYRRSPPRDYRGGPPPALSYYDSRPPGPPRDGGMSASSMPRDRGPDPGYDRRGPPPPRDYHDPRDQRDHGRYMPPPPPRTG